MIFFLNAPGKHQKDNYHPKLSQGRISDFKSLRNEAPGR